MEVNWQFGASAWGNGNSAFGLVRQVEGLRLTGQLVDIVLQVAGNQPPSDFCLASLYNKNEGKAA